MKRRPYYTLILVALLASLWGCDAANLPAPVPTPEVAGQLSVPSLTPVHNTPTATPQPPTRTPTEEPTVSPTEEPTSTPTPTSTGTATETATTEPTTTVVAEPAEAAMATATSIPRPARVPTNPVPPSQRATSTPGDAGEPPPSAWREVLKAAPGNRRIALTFDAGGTGETLTQILDTLRARNIRITMFFTGKFAEQYPEGVMQAALDGHEFANHTYSHLDSKKLSDEELSGELARAETIIQSLTGRSTKPYWRPPFGSRDNRVLRVAAQQGYRSIYWTLDSHDSVGEPKSAEFIFNRVTNTPGVNLDGAIVLQHFGHAGSAEALPRILDRLQEMGLQVVTVSELLSP